MHRRRWSRRAVLAAGLAAVTAGCAGEGADGTTTRKHPAGTRSATGDAGSDDTSRTDADADLDLREANVVGVEVTSDGGTSTFDVTLHHDDESEDGYANWWQVERLDGSRLGRRELLHPHAQQPFTRSDSYDLPADVSCVVVRGHDETHGYGGRAMLVDLSSGATRPVDQGRDPDSFAAAECPS
jgi:hypothetical protein